MIRGVILGVVLALVLLSVGAYAAVATGLVPANADATPSGLESWAARTSLKKSIEREAPRGDGPLAVTPEHLLAGAKLYATQCSACHGVADGHPSTIAAGLYQHAPQFGKDGVDDDPVGETYWKVRHGIRFTGMPAFVNSLSDEQLWEVSLFLKHMPQLPPAAEREWKSMRLPVAAAPAAPK